MTAEGREAAAPRRWSDAEIENVFGRSDDAVVRDVFQFVRRESYEGQIQSGEPAMEPKFNFYGRARRLNGTAGPNVAFDHKQSWDFVRIFLNWQKHEVPGGALATYRDDLKAAFGNAIDVSMREPGVPLTALAGSFDAFKPAVLKFQAAIDTVARG